MSLRGVLAGILIAIVLGVVLAGVLIGLGAYDFAADSPHTALTTKLIGLARERSIEVRTAGLKVPPLNNPAMIGRGAGHYAQMCVFCHLAPGMQENALRRGLNPKPPVLASLAPEEPAEQFWIVKHGLKMTAMPAWGTSHSDAEIWDIVAFLQKLPAISPQQYRAMTENAQHAHTHE
jgi:mono/diheme cytochrome c family protein